MSSRVNEDSDIRWCEQEQERRFLPHYCPISGDRIVVVVYDEPAAGPSICVEEHHPVTGELKYVHQVRDLCEFAKLIRKINSRV